MVPIPCDLYLLLKMIFASKTSMPLNCPTLLLTYLLTYLKIYLTTLAIHNIFVKIQWVDFQMGRVILTNYLNSHLNLRYSGHTAFKLVKRGCIFRLRRITIPQHCTTILKTSFKIVCFRFWKC